MEAERSAVLDILGPYVLEHFRDLIFNLSATPIDYEAISVDTRFLNLLDYRLQVVRQNNIPIHEQSISQIRGLIETIEAELGG